MEYTTMASEEEPRSEGNGGQEEDAALRRTEEGTALGAWTGSSGSEMGDPSGPRRATALQARSEKRERLNQDARPG
ncbi:hypothetical protein EYF80_045480 [Liparis tanakae]|uniref:Uncharacterized protein n=1 Tax=Liparis tanakae TaxID=230148 RepID=A0A4Z2FSW5_9TELE|nr:hypothetical protein EYF80_045480 [Liparis tanakae]